MNFKSLLSWTNMLLPKPMKVEKEGNGFFYSYVNGGTIEMPFKTNFEIFRNIPHLRAVIEKKAGYVSNFKFKIVKEDNEDEVDVKYATNKVLEHPNIFQSWRQMLYMISLYKSIQGLAVAIPGFGITDNAKGLAFLKPIDFESYKIKKKKDRLAINATKESDIIDYYRFYFADNLEADFEPEEIITFKDTYFSYTENSSRITSLMVPIENIYKALVARGELAEVKGGTGIISGGQKDGGIAVPWQPKEKEDLHDQLNSHGVAPGKKRVILTNVPLNWQSMVFPTSQLQLFEEIEDDFNTICDGFGINREIFANENTYANKNEATAGTYADTILPEVEDIFTVLNKRLKFEGTGRKLVPEYSHIRHLADNKNQLSEIAQRKSSQHIAELKERLITFEEYREFMEYKPAPELEAAYEQKQLEAQEQQKLLAQNNPKPNEDDENEKP